MNKMFKPTALLATAAIAAPSFGSPENSAAQQRSSSSPEAFQACANYLVNETELSGGTALVYQRLNVKLRASRSRGNFSLFTGQFGSLNRPADLDGDGNTFETQECPGDLTVESGLRFKLGELTVGSIPGVSTVLTINNNTGRETGRLLREGVGAQVSGSFNYSRLCSRAAAQLASKGSRGFTRLVVHEKRTYAEPGHSPVTSERDRSGFGEVNLDCRT
jgi:hypothetical protein